VDRVDALTKALEAASQLLDWAAQEIVAIPFEPKRENLGLAVSAISLVTDLKLKLYERRPHQLPSHMKGNQPHLPGNAIHDDTNPLPVNASEEIAILAAIKMIEGIAAPNRNVRLTQLAESELPKLRSLLNET
jgi:hypothetical protein